jgi:hypothetical protein
VSEALARDETLVDVFVRHAPHFEKLRDPAMRRLMARLVTAEQAACIADVPVDRLVRDLNWPVLAEHGFACEIDSSNAGHVRVRIWRAPSH